MYLPQFYVYILKCSDDSYYVGHTDNLEARIWAHERNHFKCYTSDKLPIKVVWHQDFASRIEALEAEQKIKRWSRAKKEALINKNWDLLSQLAKKKFD
jgi:predicted GIY-YIG superfamily endonuclease